MSKPQDFAIEQKRGRHARLRRAIWVVSNLNSQFTHNALYGLPSPKSVRAIRLFDRVLLLALPIELSN
jgi:hypothetical protein